ncbi:MAG: lysophospholipase [Bacteroidales bacterium]|nr:alpha/beta hydrolase [Tenuifilaceae bacterium]
MEQKNIQLTLASGENIFAWYSSQSLIPQAVICLCHGWGEHSLRYTSWAQRFVAKNYAFIAWDHYGHGQSDGKKGHIPNYNIFMEEVKLIMRKASQLFPSVPIVLYGHSMGGNIAINFALTEKQPGLLIATSPWIRLANEPSPILRFFVSILNRIAPALQIKAPVNPNGMSHSKSVVEHYKTDPLNHGKITPRLLTEITKAGKYAIANIAQLDKPFLLLHGDADSIASYHASAGLLKNCKTCSFIPFKDMYHELHNEDKVKDEVFGIICEWISGNIAD